MVMNPDYILDMLFALPAEKQEAVKQYIEKLIHEWDPDFVKLTPAEAEEIKAIQEENDYINIKDIKWDEDED